MSLHIFNSQEAGGKGVIELLNLSLDAETWLMPEESIELCHFPV